MTARDKARQQHDLSNDLRFAVSNL